jgi:hypothetical protein
MHANMISFCKTKKVKKIEKKLKTTGDYGK